MTAAPAAPATTRTSLSRRAARRLAALLPTSRARLAGPAAAVLALGTGFSALAALPAAAATLATSTAAATSTNCAASPSACGFPDATNTGVPAPAALQQVPGQLTKGPGWAWNPAGYVEVSGNGATLSGLSIAGNLDISASNVTVDGVKVVNKGQSSYGVSLRHTSNVTIEHSTISGADASSGRLMVGVKDVYGDATGTQVLADNIFYAATGVQMPAGLISGSYIHDMGYLPGDHVNGTTSNGGNTSPLTIAHNTIFNNLNQTDAVSLFQDNGAQANRVITGNLLAGGGYTIYGGSKPGSPATSIQITNNVIATSYFPKGGQYGPVAYYTPGNGNTWSGNTWDSTGQTIPSPS